MNEQDESRNDSLPPAEEEADARSVGRADLVAIRSQTRPPRPPLKGWREPPGMGQQKTKQQFRRIKHDVHGWIVLDKPVGMTSTQAVGAIKRLFSVQARRPRRHARSARLRLPADRARRSDQDRAVRHGRPQDLSLHRAAGARSATPTTPTAAWSRRATRVRTAPRSRRCCRATPAPSRRCRRNTPRSRSTASAPTTSPATARPSSSQARPVEIHRLDAGEPARRRYRRIRGRMRQGHLCPLARPRHRPGARMSAAISRRYGARRSAHSAKTT